MEDARRDHQQRRRRISLTETSRWQVATIGAFGGFGLAAMGVRPTGSPLVDVILLAAAGGFVAWSGCTAPWWMLVVIGAVSVALNPLGPGMGLGLLVIAVAAWVGLQRRSKPLIRSFAVACWMVSMGFVGDVWAFGVSSGIGIIAASLVVIGGLTRRPSADRRLARRILLGVGAFAVVCTALAGLAAYQSRGALRDANSQARAGLAAMRATDFDAASNQFNLAAESFDDASRTLSAPWAQPARLVPIVAQQWNAAHAVTDAAVNVSFDVATSADQVDLGQVTVSNGAIDIDSISSLTQPLSRLQLAIDELDTAVEEAQSPWLIPELSERLAALSGDIREQQRLGDNAVAALEAAPALLGAEQERHYFVMFTTPAEARGQGGFMGAYALLAVDEGRFSVEDFGRPRDLANGLRQPVILSDAPASWLQTWGSFGFEKEPDNRVSDDVWSIVNLSGHYPHTAQVVAELLPNSGADKVDGVFSLDVYALEALIGLVGPVEVQNGPTLDGTNTAEYLLLGQYVDLPTDDSFQEINASRRDKLDSVAAEVTSRLLGDNPPAPLDLGRALAPFVGEHRILGWSAHDQEQAVFETIDIDGRVLDEDDITVHGVERSAVKVVANNAGGNKIDSFLEMATMAEGDQVTIQFHNDAPFSGLPRYVIGSVNEDQEWGTNNLLVTIYTTDEISDLVVNGEGRVVAANREADRYVYTFGVDIPSRETATITFTAGGDDPLLINEPPPGRRPTPDGAPTTPAPTTSTPPDEENAESTPAPSGTATTPPTSAP